MELLVSDEVKKPFGIPPSDEFVDIVSTGGSIVADCELCGRVCFEEHGDFEPGELEGLQEKAKNNPEKYVEFGYGEIRTAQFDGKQVVTNCPCNLLRTYENWIWSHRHIIADYVKGKAERFANRACEDEAEAEFLQEAVERFGIKADVTKEFSKCQGCGGYFDKKSLDERLMCSGCSGRDPEAEEALAEDDEDEVNEPGMGFVGDFDDDNLPF